MRKIKALLTAFTLMLLIMLSSCTSLPEPEVSEITDAVTSAVTLESGFSTATDAEISVLFGCDIGDYEAVSVLYSTDAMYADIIAVFKSENSHVQSETREFLDEFIESRLADFTGYAPEEVKKIEDSGVISYGLYDILVISSDFDAAESAVDKLFRAD